MAIARTASGQIGASTAVTGISGAFNCSGGDFLIAFARTDNADTQTCTYNGVSMTSLGVSTVNTYGTAHQIQVFILSSPAAGSNTLASSGTGSTYRALQAIAYSGTKLSGQPDAQSLPAGTTGTSLSTNITTIAANSWIAGIYVNDNGGTVTATGSAVIIGTTFSNPGSVDMLWDTNGAVASPGSVTVGGQSTVSGGQALAAVSIAPPSATAAAAVHYLTLLGVGV